MSWRAGTTTISGGPPPAGLPPAPPSGALIAITRPLLPRRGTACRPTPHTHTERYQGHEAGRRPFRRGAFLEMAAFSAASHASCDKCKRRGNGEATERRRTAFLLTELDQKAVRRGRRGRQLRTGSRTQERCPES